MYMAIVLVAMLHSMACAAKHHLSVPTVMTGISVCTGHSPLCFCALAMLQSMALDASRGAATASYNARLMEAR